MFRRFLRAGGALTVLAVFTVVSQPSAAADCAILTERGLCARGDAMVTKADKLTDDSQPNRGKPR
jgi:hypothetical protein